MESQYTKREPRVHMKWIAMILAMICAVGVFTSASPPASHAAEQGPGLHIEPIGHVGSFRLADGSLAYCIEVAMYQPLSAQAATYRSETLPAYTGVEGAGNSYGFFGPRVLAPAVNDRPTMVRLNYILSTWGQTTDNEQAVAVALAVFSLRADNAGLTDHFIQTVRNNGGERAYQRSLQMLAEASELASLPVTGEPAVAPTVTIDAHGRGQVQFGEGTHLLRAENGIFPDSGTTELAVTGPGTVEIQGVRPAGWDAFYDVTVHADWASGTEGYAGEVWIFDASNAGEQRIAAGTGMTTGNRRSGTATTTVTVENRWAPTIRTQVTNRVVEVGEVFSDAVSVEADPAGGHWSVDAKGRYMPIHLRGTLYGPLREDPTTSPQDEAPDGTPVAAEVELIADAGPGEYTVSAPVTAIESGYYTWVWRAEWQDQADDVTHPKRTGIPALLESEFPISDRFGEVEETHIVPQRLSMVTRLDEGEVGRGWSVVDRVAVTNDQHSAWFTVEDGSGIPVTMRGTLYHVSDLPERAHEAPETAEVVAEVLTEVTGPQIITTEEIPVPVRFEGWLVMQWCILSEDQRDELRGLTREWCDDFGVPHETAKIYNPKVTTRATADVTLGDVMRDTAIVEGFVPHGASVDFIAYLRPEIGEPIYDDDWQDTGRTWTRDAIDELGDGVCTAQQVAVTERVPVTGPGEFVSPDVRTQSPGTIHWVERLWASDPVTGEEILIHEGECGLVEETTYVTMPATAAPEPQATELANTGTGEAMLLGGVGLGVLAMLTGIVMFFHGSRSCRSSES